MTVVRVAESIDISAQRDDVFAIVTHPVRRLQLSPFWGTTQICEISPEFPARGSCFRSCPTTDGLEPHNASVTDFVPGQKFSYALEDSIAQDVVWMVQEVRGGVRLRYEESFEVDDAASDDFIREVRQAIVKWLTNIKRYAELHTSRTKRFARWALDRYYLKLRPDQRNVIVAVLAMQAISSIAGIMGIIAFGFTRLLA
jgi:hypothetical protein